MNLPRREQAFDFQKRVSDLLQNELSDSLEDVLDNAFPPDKVIRIDSLSLDLGEISAQNFEQEFKTRFIEGLSKSLSSKRADLNIAGDEDTVMSKAKSLVSALIFFLEKGYLPWYSSAEKKAGWETELLDNLSDTEYHYFLNWLRDNYKESPVIIERLVLQFSDNFIGELLSKIAPVFDDEWDVILADYAFILGNIGGSVAADRSKKTQKTIKVLPGLQPSNSKFNASIIRNKIRQYAFQTLLDSGERDQGFNILRLLFVDFEIKNRDITTFTRSVITGGLNTNTVKHAFKKLLDLLSNEEMKRKAADTDSQKNKGDRANNTTGADVENTNDTSAETQKQTKNLSENVNDRVPENLANIPALNQASADGSPLKASGEETGTTHPQNKKPGKSPPAGDVTDEVDNPKKDATATQGRKKKKHLLDAGELIDVRNSGVVLLHPFLGAYFADLDLLVERDFINNEARARAVLLLNYLATGETEAAEFDLTLQKILCGYPLEDTLVSSIIPTDKEKAESGNLLNAVTSHWEPLKNTSIAGLRGTFLQRNGNIETKESGWLLKVEQKGFDILLAKLPWGFSTIRLPWMQKMLSVDWY